MLDARIRVSGATVASRIVRTVSDGCVTCGPRRISQLRKYLLFLTVSLISATGCRHPVAGLAAVMVVKSAHTQEQRQEFTAQLQKTNTERESKGLKPLDWCSEAYRFDVGWAESDSACAKRIEAYEAGDKSALDAPQPLLPVAPDSTKAVTPP